MLSRRCLRQTSVLRYRKPLYVINSRLSRPASNRFASINNNSLTPPVTYFQEPQPQKPRWRWRVFRGTVYVLLVTGISAYSFGLGQAYAEISAPEDPMNYDNPLLSEAMHISRALLAWVPHPHALIECRMTADRSAISHTAISPSNMPCEDAANSMINMRFSEHDQNWQSWTITDGHAGSRLSFYLSTALPAGVFNGIADRGLMDTSGGEADDDAISQSIQNTFLALDASILRDAVAMSLTSPQTIDALRADLAIRADSGSCALLALYDPNSRRLRIANTGDSRAVLGRWDQNQQRYIAWDMSVEHNGFNEIEKQRIAAEHPGEEPIDPKTGRLFGLAVTRAFGDSRWKLDEEDQKIAHQRFCAHPPRPNGVIKTPPYLTAAPDVRSVTVNIEERPDFLILASDGLWEHLTPAEAVDCVQLWLDKYTPQYAVAQSLNRGQGQEPVESEPDWLNPTIPPPSLTHKDQDIYYDEESKSMKWTNNAKHFVAEREHCGQHLILNALGGDRTSLVQSLLCLPPSHSRAVRDDITATVVFFGADTSDIPKEILEPARLMEQTEKGP